MKFINSDESSMAALANLGEQNFSYDNVKKGLENYVCKLYGSGSTNIEQLRWDTYNRDQDPDKLPPTADALTQKILRSHLVASIWKSSGLLDPRHLDPLMHGWERDDETGGI